MDALGAPAAGRFRAIEAGYRIRMFGRNGNMGLGRLRKQLGTEQEYLRGWGAIASDVRRGKFRSAQDRLRKLHAR
jgi:hypothetical protein